MSTRRSLFAELKRRNVWRAAAVYVAGAWALAQGIAQLGPAINAPPWITRWFLVAACIGFPFWVAFAWFYAWTPQGFKREEVFERTPALARSTGRKLDFWIIGIMAIAIVLLVTNQFVLHRDATSRANAADTKAALAALAKVPQKSVAVLPLVNESGDPKRQYFSDGLSEELISDLTQINGLKVIGKYSSFKFRNSKDPPAVICATLGVANLIEGSVRQAGKRIRIVVNLIRAKDGASVWSRTYNQKLQDVFAIQSQIGHAVASALKVKLLGKTLAKVHKPPGGDVKAYQLMLQGRAQPETKAGFEKSIALLGKAVRIDPHYAYAWGLLAGRRLNFGFDYLHGLRQQQAYADARAALDHETALEPNALRTLMDRGYQFSMLDFDQAGALAQYQRAVTLAPNSGAAKAALAGQLGQMGHLQASVDLYRQAIATNPLSASLLMNLSYMLAGLGHLDRAEQAARTALALQPGIPAAHAQLATIDILRHDTAAARRDAAGEPVPGLRAWALAGAKQIGGSRHAADAALRTFIDKYGDARPYFVAELYAMRKQPDEMFKWLDRSLTHHKSAIAFNLLVDPLVARYQHDPRFAALCKQVGLPEPHRSLPAATASVLSTSTRKLR